MRGAVSKTRQRLEDAGYKVGEGAIWYAGSRERVRIALDETLRARTRSAIAELRLAAAAGRLPPPLVDSPKCTKCSLVGICLPDEVAFFRRGMAPRPLNPAADTALPLYVQEPGERVSKSGEVLVVRRKGAKPRYRSAMFPSWSCTGRSRSRRQP
jgi:hypothetical protein